MTDVHLTERSQAALRTLMATDPVPGDPLPDRAVLEALHRLVPCDALGVGITDLYGRTLEHRRLHPHGGRRTTLEVERPVETWPDAEGSPHYLGYMLWRRNPSAAICCGNERFLRRGDGLAIGYRNGGNHIVQYWFARESRRFSDGELALFELLGPVLQRLARERATPSLPAALTVTERRILSHVAAGRNNAQIAGDLFIATGTVRKHLENSYRKLGVGNRVAAVARLQGRDLGGLDLKERIDRYA